ncbi:hypothetical protein BJY01DRAFT_238421 [Aspergillus pseudoustus]|uniref:Uncharacterized protein n=1 Tax=Aspergillus pseudoustus TaxID=1810923 RepID=A0ABR4J816_9EURO
MTDQFSYTYPSPLEGYEGLEPLSDERNEDGKSLKNHQHGILSKAYEVFPDPLSKGRRGGFDIHIYHFQNNPDQVTFAKALWERIRREFPELRIYTFWDKPVGPHPVAMFEVNLFTPAQFGAFVPWLVINRGPLSALIHPNTAEGAGEEERNHTQRATWLGERIPLDLRLFKLMKEKEKREAAPVSMALYARSVDATLSGLAATSLPNYVLDYAPLVWLHSEDPYKPSGIAKHLEHVVAQVDYQPVAGAPSPITLDNLDQLNALGNESVYLSSQEGIDANPQPSWFNGASIGENGQSHDVSSIVVVHDRGGGEIDAFYFYFYSEHNMIRFQNGTPQAIWYSQHSAGQAFTYGATEKQGSRPIAYSANGTHAVYAISGGHDHTIPGVNLPVGFLVDHTNQGTLWDPVLGAYAYSYASDTKTIEPYDPTYPVNWLNFNGRWGDDALPSGPELFGQAKYVGGPTGPKFKNLDRELVCPSDPCIVLPFRVWSVESSEAQSTSA